MVFAWWPIGEWGTPPHLLASDVIPLPCSAERFQLKGNQQQQYRKGREVREGEFFRLFAKGKEPISGAPMPKGG